MNGRNGGKKSCYAPGQGKGEITSSSFECLFGEGGGKFELINLTFGFRQNKGSRGQWALTYLVYKLYQKTKFGMQVLLGRINLVCKFTNKVNMICNFTNKLNLVCTFTNKLNLICILQNRVTDQ